MGLYFYLLHILVFAAHGEAIQILFSDTFHNTDIEFTKSGDTWLKVNQSTGAISKIKIRIEPGKGYSKDEPPSDTSSDVTYDHGSEQTFLVRGIPIKKSIVVYPFKTEGPGYDFEKDIFIEVGPKKEKITFSPSNSETRKLKQIPIGPFAYKLKIKYMNKEITLIDDPEAHYIHGSPPYTPAWAGDLNSDGFPDFLIHQPTHESGAMRRILLMSKKGNGTISFEKVASIHAPGC